MVGYGLLALMLWGIWNLNNILALIIFFALFTFHGYLVQDTSIQYNLKFNNKKVISWEYVLPVLFILMIIWYFLGRLFRFTVGLRRL